MARSWSWWRAVGPLMVLAAAVGLFMLLVATRPVPAPVEPAEPAWPVATVAAEPGVHRPMMRLYGHVESPSRITLSAAVTADVAEVPAREGRLVEAGELLVDLDGAELRDTLRQREAELAELEAALAQEQRAVAADRETLEAEKALLTLAERREARMERLRAEDAVSDSELDDAREALQRQRMAVTRSRLAVESAAERTAAATARRDRAAAARDLAARDLERSRVEAPFAGRVTRVEIGAGERVSPGTPLVSLFDTAALEIRTHLPANRIAAVRRALAAGGDIAAEARIDDAIYPLRLERLAGQSAADEGGQSALFSVAGRHGEIPLGRFAAVDMALPPEPGTVVLPFEALYGRDRVYRVVDQRMEPVEVARLGEAYLPDGRRGALLRAPELEEGDRVVVTQVPRATAGLRVIEEGAATAPRAGGGR